MQLLTVGGKGSENPKFRAMVDKYNDNPMLKEQIAVAEADFTSYEQIGFLMVDALRIGTGVDIALINPGGVRINHLPKGNISIMDAYSCDPFGNEIVQFNLTGHEIKNLYRVAYPMDEDLPIYPSGMKTKYHISADGKFADVEFLNLDGSPFDMDKTYSVAVNSYIASAYKFEKEDEGRGLFQGTAENMIDYLRNLKVIPSYQNEKRVEGIGE